MCPDIEAFAPLIQATFGATEDGRRGSPDLRVRLADRSLRQTNPVLGVVAELLELADARLTASQVLGLADREPVRRRFGLDDDDLARLQDWATAAGVRWGLDAAHRAPFSLAALEAGTWKAGLDRLLVGVTMAEEGARLFGDVLPLDDVESGAIDLAGRAAELVDRLQAAVDALREPQPVAAWAAAIGAAADALTATTERQSWQRAELQRLLDDMVREARERGARPRAARAARPARRAAAGPARRARTSGPGHLTVCTLVPMRSVPHRVVCLLGLDDGAFPRRAPRDGDDLVPADAARGRPRSTHRGPPDAARRADGRHGPADRHLHRQRRAHERPPPARRARRRAARRRRPHGAGRRAGRRAAQVEVRHPLQPFDPRNFAPGELVRGRSVGLRPGDAGRRPRARLPARAAAAVPRGAAARAGRSRWWSSTSWCASPSARCARSCAGGWGCGCRSWAARSTTRCRSSSSRWPRRAPASACSRRAWPARASTPRSPPSARAASCRPGRLAEPVLAEIQPIVELIAARAASELDLAAAPASVDVRVELPGGRTLRGTVPGVRGSTLGVGEVRAAEPPPPARRVGPLPGAHRVGAHGRRRDGRPRSRRRRRGDREARAARRGGRGRAPGGARRPPRPRPARAAPARLPGGRGLRARRGPRRGRGGGRAPRVGVDVCLGPRGPRARAPARVRRRRSPSTSCSPSSRRAGEDWDERRSSASASSPCGCGPACSVHEVT